jgi:hypothetical protein
MKLTVAEMGVLCILLFGLFHYLRILAKTRSVLALLGAASVGLDGAVGRLAGSLAVWAQRVAGNITAWAFGVSLSAALFVVLAILLVHDLHPKKNASARTGWVALTVGVFLVAGVSQLPVLAPVAGAIRSLLSDITGFVNTTL